MCFHVCSRFAARQPASGGPNLQAEAALAVANFASVDAPCQREEKKRKQLIFYLYLFFSFSLFGSLFVFFCRGFSWRWKCILEEEINHSNDELGSVAGLTSSLAA